MVIPIFPGSPYDRLVRRIIHFRSRLVQTIVRRAPNRAVTNLNEDQSRTVRSKRVLALAMLATPILTFISLRWFTVQLDHSFAIPREHFLVVSLACIAAIAMAVVLGYAAVKTREPRTFFLAATFIALAGPFSVHGLMTPGQTFSMHGFHNSLAVSAQLALFLGAVFMLLSTVPFSAPISAFIRDQFGLLMSGLILLAIGYVVICLSIPTFLDWVPTGNEPDGITTAFGLERGTVGLILRYSTMSIGICMALFAGRRYYQSFAISNSFATAAMAISALLLGEALFIQAFGVLWHTSWWMYHVLLLITVCLPMLAFALLYRRGSSLLLIVDSLLINETLAKVEYAFPEAIDTFIETVEARDPYLKGHMRRVCELSVAIAEEMKVPDSSMRAASYAALLHDIGKLGLPPAILNKPGRLSDDEFEVLKEHPTRGFALIANVESLRIAAPAIRWHHERLDGSGYPDALAGNDVPIEARIIAVADVWDALTSDRSYRAAMTTAEAMAIIESESGTKLDPACVNALIKVTSRGAGFTYQLAAVPLAS